MTTIDAFKQAMNNAGIEPPGEIVADGSLHRFTVAGDKSRSNNAWYVLHTDDPAAGSFGCWKRQISETWSSKEYRSMTNAEKDAYTAKMEAMKRQREEEQKLKQAECREWCKRIWSKAKDATNDHPYLKRKGVNAYGLKTLGDSLLIPVVSRWSMIDIRGIQFIAPDGSKKFKTGTDKTGNSFQIGNRTEDGVVIICEGYATGASIYQATKQCVVVAFDAGNLLPVAQMVRSWNVKKIIIAADNDHATDGNPGVTKATEAARVVDGLLAIPSGKGTDFNDIHQTAGLKAVRSQIESATPVMDSAQPEPAGEANCNEAVVSDHSVNLIQASTIKPECITWLWKGWLPGGKLVIVAGQPGTGKTTLVLAIAAITTRGGILPDGARAEIGSVIIWSGEDGVDDTLVPRLIAMGADMTKVFFVTGRAGKPFDPSKDMPGLSAQLAVIPNVKMVVVDPIVSAVNGDSHKNAEVRKSLQPLVDLGRDTGACILGITHFSKMGDNAKDPLGLVSGSIAFGAVARVVLGAAKVRNPDELGFSRIFCRIKSNIGPDEDGIGYDLNMVDLPGHDGIEASTVRWGAYITGHSRDLLTPSTQEPERPTRSNEAAEFLKGVLADGSVSQKTIEEQAEQAGISYVTLKRAKKAIGVVSCKVVSGWYWELPDKQGDRARGSKNTSDTHDPLEVDNRSQGDQEAQGDHKNLTRNMIPLNEPLDDLPDFDDVEVTICNAV